MIEKCANVIADWLISNKVVERTDKELYSYTVYSVLLSLSPLTMAIGFGICMGCVGQSITIIIPFAIIRKFSGGVSYQTFMVMSDMVKSAIIAVHNLVILHQMRLEKCLDYCRNGCKPDT